MTEHLTRLNAQTVHFDGGLFDGCSVDLVPSAEPSLITVTPDLPACIRFGPDPGQMRPWTVEQLTVAEVGTYDYQRVDGGNRYAFVHRHIFGQENP